MMQRLADISFFESLCSTASCDCSVFNAVSGGSEKKLLSEAGVSPSVASDLKTWIKKLPKHTKRRLARTIGLRFGVPAALAFAVVGLLGGDISSGSLTSVLVPWATEMLRTIGYDLAGKPLKDSEKMLSALPIVGTIAGALREVKASADEQDEYVEDDSSSEQYAVEKLARAMKGVD